MHPAHTGHPGFGWIRRGRDQELRAITVGVNVNINGALSWPDRTVVHLEAEKITSGSGDRAAGPIGGVRSHGNGDRRCARRCELLPLGSDQVMSGPGWMSHPAGVFAGLSPNLNQFD
jgi:hypothetical protein